MILDDIAAAVYKRLADDMEKTSLSEMKKAAENMSPLKKKTFKEALRKSGMSFICEVKKASPSKGTIVDDFPYIEIAQEYEAAGADAVSVLTERDYFKGSIECLRDIAKSIGLPVLRKDFIVEPYQIYEAKAAGASAVLLICALLPQEELTELVDLTRSLDMDALVEAHNKEEISQALWAGADIIGVNNRNLKDFTVSLDTSVNLRRAVPKEIIFVAESGICSAEDISLLRKNRVDAVLIGESLMRSNNKKRTLAALKGVGGED